MQLYGERKEGKKSRGRRRNIFYDRTAVRLNERGEGNAANKRERTRNGTGGPRREREREKKEKTERRLVAFVTGVCTIRLGCRVKGINVLSPTPTVRWRDNVYRRWAKT